MNSNVNENQSSTPTETEVNITDDIKDTNYVTDVQNSKTIELTTDAHDKVLTFLVKELNSLKESNNEKDLCIQNLNDKIVELTAKLEELDNKLNKKDNLGLLLKLKENLTNKQHEIKHEMNHEIESSNTKTTKTTETTETNEFNFSVEDKIQNVILEDDSPSLKPKKKPAVFRRRF
jgi:hypothetical protein